VDVVLDLPFGIARDLTGRRATAYLHARGGAMRRGLTFIGLIMFGLPMLAVGCGADIKQDCLDICDKFKDCPGADPNCSSNCNEPETNVTKACEGEADDLAQCVLQINDACNPPQNACTSQLEALEACGLDYCSKNPQDPNCAIPG
jgi:hypothetical protein